MAFEKGTVGVVRVRLSRLSTVIVSVLFFFSRLSLVTLLLLLSFVYLLIFQVNLEIAKQLPASKKTALQGWPLLSRKSMLLEIS